MNNQPEIITSERLLLIPTTPALLEASLAYDVKRAETELGLALSGISRSFGIAEKEHPKRSVQCPKWGTHPALPPEWFEERGVMVRRLDQLQADIALQPWLLRVIVERQSDTVIGRIGFHGYPGADYLCDYAPAAAELGYTIFPAYRRQGYAREATAAMIDWARTTQGVQQFVLSISPDNYPSQRIAAHFGFQKGGAMGR